MSNQAKTSEEEVKRLIEEMRRRRAHEEIEEQRRIWQNPIQSPPPAPLYTALMKENESLRGRLAALETAGARSRGELIRLAGEVARLVREKAQDAADFEIEREQAFTEGYAAGWRHARAAFWHLLRVRLAQALGRLDRCPERSAERTQGMVIALEGLIGEVRSCAGVHAVMTNRAMSALAIPHAERIADPRSRMPFHKGVNAPDDSPNQGTIQTLLDLEEQARKETI